MALRETTITGIHTDFDGTPISEAVITVTWNIKLGYTATHTIVQPPGGFPCTTEFDGSYTMTLWAEDTDSIVPNTQIIYTAYFPVTNNTAPDIALADTPKGSFSVPYNIAAQSLPDLIRAWALANP
ncbi:MAG: hypothetical protein M3367_02855 [Acidobacteriota bacterium]|nr:hypothetical protein [Acidobacteriota bacterium]